MIIEFDGHTIWLIALTVYVMGLAMRVGGAYRGLKHLDEKAQAGFNQTEEVFRQLFANMTDAVNSSPEFCIPCFDLGEPCPKHREAEE